MEREDGEHAAALVARGEYVGKKERLANILNPSNISDYYHSTLEMARGEQERLANIFD